MLAENNYNLICIGRSSSKFEKFKEQLPSNISLKVYECDLSSKEQLMLVSNKIKQSEITIDILLHSAGVILPNSVINSELEEFDIQMNVNFQAPYLLTKFFLPLIVKCKGQIVFVNSSIVNKTISNLSLYSASKLALKGFADTLREEVNPLDVRVISVFPGKTATEMQKKLNAGKAKKHSFDNMLQPEDVAVSIINALKLKCTAELTDIYLRPMSD